MCILRTYMCISLARFTNSKWISVICDTTEIYLNTLHCLTIWLPMQNCDLPICTQTLPYYLTSNAKLWLAYLYQNSALLSDFQRETVTSLFAPKLETAAVNKPFNPALNLHQFTNLSEFCFCLRLTRDLYIPGFSKIRNLRHKYSLISIFRSFILRTSSRIISFASASPNLSKQSKSNVWPDAWKQIKNPSQTYI